VCGGIFLARFDPVLPIQEIGIANFLSCTTLKTVWGYSHIELQAGLGIRCEGLLPMRSAKWRVSSLSSLHWKEACDEKSGECQ
jgi:hypothetical protein